MAVHMSPAFMDVELGDIVTVGECRPLSKTVRFNVIKGSVIQFSYTFKYVSFVEDLGHF